MGYVQIRRFVPARPQPKLAHTTLANTTRTVLERILLGFILVVIVITPGLLAHGDPAFNVAEPLNTNAAADGGRDILPAIATDGSGNWVAVWASTDTLEETLGEDYDILLARSVDNGHTWTDPVPLNSSAPTDSDDDLY
ncbi:MAG: exo-alpha-sialidase, partial [Candidatus Hydrogenedentes bacterium]|nr:exo-alpha-sialidase [Candidatus Hydrogenedentota bacterium]